ncbi:hypothetical protein CHS0354_041462 [Potamilus streckersoni]|uniref:GTPase Era, mitochondrial n=1 Tax=Potamilus streckersoni TaxID=2493646 RepID=A0AAE0WAQ5_9BIVA|nr:hypothetical protein CHS0354_041462 [Potamilus streckersoni]
MLTQRLLTWCRQLQVFKNQQGLYWSAVVTGSKQCSRHKHNDQPQFVQTPTTEDIERAIGKMPEDQRTRSSLRPDQPPDAQILRVSIIGSPNAGKSTLTNQLMNWKVSSVSKKVHTTRKNTRAVLTEGSTQIVFLDTPGILHPGDRKKHHLEASLYYDPGESLKKADLVGVVVDVANKWTRNSLHSHLLKILKENQHIPSFLILNKVDMVQVKPDLLHILRRLTDGVIDGKVIQFKKKKLIEKKKENSIEFLEKLEQSSEQIHFIDSGNKSEKKQRERTDECFEKLQTKTASVATSKKIADVGKKCVAHNKVERQTEGSHIAEKSEVTGPEESRLLDMTESEFQAGLNNFISNLGKGKDRVLKAKGENMTINSSSDLTKQNENSDFRRMNDSDVEGSFGSEKLNLEPDLLENETERLSTEFEPRLHTNDSERSNQDTSCRTNLATEGLENMTPRFRKLGGMEVLKDWTTPNNERMNSSVEFEEMDHGWPYFKRVFMISALTGDGVEDLKEYLLENAQLGDWDYHSSLVTDQDPMEAARTFVWEKILDYLPDEVPYLLYPEILMWEEDDAGVLNIIMQVEGLRKRDLICLLQKRGEIITKIAQEAKQEIMNAFRCDVKFKIIARQKQKYSK